MRKSVGEVAGEVAAATTALLRAWDEVPAMVELELREASPGFVSAFERWVAAEAALLAAKQDQDRAHRGVAIVHPGLAGVPASNDLTIQAHSIAAVHEDMPR
jgi:hypothetical protein